MPDRRPIIVPPSPETLRRFFRERQPSTIAEAAVLAGWTRAQVKQRAVDEDALLRDGLVRWKDLAAWVLEAWPRRWVLDTLGDDASLLPLGLHLGAIALEVPSYLAHAYNVQWRVEPMPHRMRRPENLSDYMADFLHRVLDDTTLAVMQHDADFRAAYEYPREDDDA
ncbi:MAG TPA: hypothetical protein VEO54_03470 [Thermoanaerobaculia bacterium]|nr:hypothetical protein [Thermoanaerobaculia bacterium]